MLHSREDYNRFLSQDPSGKIHPEEPVFLIRAQDVVSGDAVRAWAELHERARGSLELARSAREHAAKMDAWPQKKLADL